MTQLGYPKSIGPTDVRIDQPRLDDQGGTQAPVTHLPVIFRFRLYITGAAPNSLRAIHNLNALCREHLTNRHHIEIVDVLVDANRALAEGALLTPTLFKVLPEPVCKIVGTLGDTRTVLETLGLPVSTL